MGVGDLMCCSFYMNDPFLLAAAGSKGQLAIWETSEQNAIDKTFSGRITKTPTVNYSTAPSVFSSGNEADAGSASGKQSFKPMNY